MTSSSSPPQQTLDLADEESAELVLVLLLRLIQLQALDQLLGVNGGTPAELHHRKDGLQTANGAVAGLLRIVTLRRPPPVECMSNVDIVEP